MNAIKLSTFQFSENYPIRAFEKNGISWFVAADVCKALDIQNPTQALEKLDDDERAMFNIGLENQGLFDSRIKEVNIINESGLYILILRSRNAMKQGTIQHKFRKWVTSEVLPQIRKTGGYQVSGSLKPIPNKTTSLDREPLRNAVNLLVRKKGLNFSEAYTLVHQRFNVAHLDELDSEQIPQAVEYVHRVLCGEVLDRLPETTSTLHLTEQDLRSLSCVIRFMPHLLAYYHLTEDAVRSLNRRLCGTVHDRFQDGYLHACHLARSLNIEQQDWRKAVQEIQLHANLI